MATEQVAEAAVVAALFFILQLASMASFKHFKFKLYLLLGLSCLFRGVGFSLQAVFLDNNDKNYRAASLAFAAAGFGISIAVLLILMGCWWKNAPKSARPGRSMKLSIGTRLLIAPVVIFGPIMGIMIAALIYGVATPSALTSANTMRHAASWGMFTVEMLLLAITTAAAVGVWRMGSAESEEAAAKSGAGKGSSGGTSVDDPNKLVLVPLCCSGLLAIAAIFRVVGLYHVNYLSDPKFFYTLQALPELLDAVVLLVPGLMAHVGMAGRYDSWRAGELPGSPWAGAAAAASVATGAV